MQPAAHSPGGGPCGLIRTAEFAAERQASRGGRAPLPAKVALISHGVAGVRAVPLSGRAELGITGGAWTLTHDHRVGSIQLAGFSSGRLGARGAQCTLLQ